MGTRWYLDLDCAHCGKIHEDVYYAPTCGIYNLTCDHCGEVSGIVESFKTTKEKRIDPDFDN